MATTITLGAMDIAVTADKVRIASQRVNAKSDIVTPLRAATVSPRARGALSIDWTIEVDTLHADRAAAEAFMASVETAALAAMAHSDAPIELVISTRGTYPAAVMNNADIRDMGLTTRVVYSLTSSAPTPPPP